MVTNGRAAGAGGGGGPPPGRRLGGGPGGGDAAARRATSPAANSGGLGEAARRESRGALGGRRPQAPGCAGLTFGDDRFYRT